MKKAFPLFTAFICFITAISMVSCGPGRWVGGNAKHFQQRAAAKAAKEVKPNIVNRKP